MSGLGNSGVQKVGWKVDLCESCLCDIIYVKLREVVWKIQKTARYENHLSRKIYGDHLTWHILDAQ